MLEAIAICERIAGKPLQWTYDERARIGDHIWYVSDLRKFRRDYPGWDLTYTIERVIEDIYLEMSDRLSHAGTDAD
jgi:CDP-paratose 2-epimerase